jgi:hypothetical protein
MLQNIIIVIIVAIAIIFLIKRLFKCSCSCNCGKKGTCCNGKKESDKSNSGKLGN